MQTDRIEKAMEIGGVAGWAVLVFFGGLWILSQGFFWATWVSFVYLVMMIVVADIVAYISTIIATYWYFKPRRN